MPTKWMIDAKGSGGDGGDKTTKEYAMQVLGGNDAAFAALIDMQGGLSTSVQKHIADMGYQASDRGAGGGDWHVGVGFNVLDDAVQYLDAMTRTFAAAIAAGMLRFELKTWTRSMWKQHGM
jgi:hypothetical protein